MALPFYTDVEVHGRIDIDSAITVDDGIAAKSLVISTAGAHTETTADPGDVIVGGALTAESLTTLNGGVSTSSITATGVATLNGGISTSAITATGVATLNGGLNVTNGGALVNGGLTVTGGGITANTIECSNFYREETKFNGLSSGANLDVQLAFSNNNTTATITVPAIKEEGLYYLVARLYTSAGRIIIDQVCWLEDNPVFEHHGRAAYINDYSPVWTDIHYYFWVSTDGLKIVIKSAGALNSSSISNPAQVEITKIFGTSLLPS